MTAFARVTAVLALWAASLSPAIAADELVTTARLPDGETIPYMVTDAPVAPRFAVVLMPGGSGRLEPRIEDGRLKFSFGGNFLIRSRRLFADSDFVAIAADATGAAERMLALVADIERRFVGVKIYIVGTSASTRATMSLARTIDGRVAGFIHTSSFSEISGLDTRGLKSRNLLVHHANDICRVTPFWGAERAHERYQTPLIAMRGGISVGDDCEVRAHHGYNGIERETVEKIKAWIRTEP
ncbi:MAG: hypothetical protein FJX61_01190 [Alphaproteobacteria bacterium]|nr:hypothetical protein [Alphaproteobacteria bacterium]